MEIFDAEGEYDEIVIGMLIKMFSNKNKNKEFQVKGKRYLDEYPFEEIGNLIIDNGLEIGDVIYNDSEKCVIEYEDIYYEITYKKLNEKQIDDIISILYTIKPIYN